MVLALWEAMGRRLQMRSTVRLVTVVQLLSAKIEAVIEVPQVRHCA